MTPGSQFPDLAPENLGASYIDPAVIDRPVTYSPPRPQSLGGDILFTAIVAFFLAMCALFGGI